MQSKKDRDKAAQNAIRQAQNIKQPGIGFQSMLNDITMKLAYSEHLAAIGLETPETAQRLAAAHLLIRRFLEIKNPEKQIKNRLSAYKHITSNEDPGATSTMDFLADEQWMAANLELFNFLAQEGRQDRGYGLAAEQLLLEISRKAMYDMALGHDTHKIFKEYFTDDVISTITHAAKDDPTGPVMRIEKYREALLNYFMGFTDDAKIMAANDNVMDVSEYNARFVKNKIDAFEDVDSSFEGSGFSRLLDTGKQYATMAAKPEIVAGKKPDESVDAPMAVTQKHGDVPSDLIPQSAWLNAAMTYAQMEVQGC